MRKFQIAFISGILLSSALAWASPVFEVSPAFTEAKLDSQIESWNQTVASSADAFFRAAAQNTGRTRFGYIRQPIWLRFALKNSEDRPRKLILTLDPPLIDELNLTEFDEDGKIIQTAGFDLKDRVQAGALFRRRPAFEITLLPRQVTTFVLRIFSTHSMDLHLSVATRELESRSALTDNLAMGAYYGVFFMILLLNLLIYFATWDRLYLCYVGFLVALGMQLSCLNGFLDFNFGGSFVFARYLCAMSAAALITGHNFSRKFLQTRTTAPRLDRAHLVMIAVATVIGSLNLSQIFPRLHVGLGIAIDTTIALSILLIIASTLTALKRGYRPAVFFLIAWGSFLCLVGLYFSATYGVIHGNSFTQYAVQIGSSTEMVLLSIALGYRLYSLKEAKNLAEKKAQESDHLRSLIHIICHDLRNPLTVISGMAQANLNRGSKEWVAVSRAVKSQQDILDYVRLKEGIETGKHQLRMIPVPIADAVENARFVFESRIREKNIRWNTEIEPGCAVLADRTLMIHTVIVNLVSNAIKFTPDGGEVRITAFSSGKDVVIEIRDNGIGIPQELLPHLFSARTPTTRPGTRGEKGNGFGMPLVKTVVESFGGKLTVKSVCADESGKSTPSGTRVILSLRRADLDFRAFKFPSPDLKPFT